MRKLHCLLALALAGASSPALSLPLNTGFNNSNFTVYTAPGSGPAVLDNYWIKVAASNGSSVAPAYVINKHQAWLGPLPLPPSDGGFGSQYIGMTTPDGTSPPGTFHYAIYRKCFCLLRGFKQPKLNFQIRGDDAIAVWLNNSTVLPVQGGNFSGPAINGAAQASQFQTGRNCLYVLVLDTGSVVSGFNLAGTVSAFGLMPMAAAGTGASFTPCQCTGGPRAAVEDDRATLRAIVRVAEQHRRTEASPNRN